MALQNKTVRISEETHKQLSNDFGQFSTACQLILEPFDRLRAVTIQELKGYFTKEEITTIIGSQNGVLLTADFVYNKSFLIAQLEDFESLDSGAEFYGADMDKIIDKVNELSQSQVYYLLLDTHIFWNTGQDLNNYLEKF